MLRLGGLGRGVSTQGCDGRKVPSWEVFLETLELKVPSWPPRNPGKFPGNSQENANRGCVGKHVPGAEGEAGASGSVFSLSLSLSHSLSFYIE